MNKSKIHLVCSSGGVKCFSYLGAISRLYSCNIEVASISACSMGSVMGALIASGVDLKILEEKILNFKFKDLKRTRRFAHFKFLKSFFWGGKKPFALSYTPDYESVMKYFFGEDLTMSQLKIPFSALALDIRQKRFLVYSTETHPDMKVSEVIKIATSVPLLYEPHKIEKRLLVDAAVATESPVWMAVNQPGNYPIVVLKVSKELNSINKSKTGKYVENLMSVSAESHDYFAASQISRNIDININCENMGAANFDITKEQIETLILQGEAAADQQLKEFGNDFNHILNFETQQPVKDIGSTFMNQNQVNDDSKNAEILANKMITGFSQEMLNRNQIFVSYSHLDKKWLEKLNYSLNAVERFTGIKAWSDTLILPSDFWNSEISKALSSAKVAVFLVTPHFLASKFIQENEMNYFLKIKEEQHVPIIWIAVSDCLYDITPLQDIQCANDPKLPLDTLTDAEQNIEIAKICKKIITLMK